MASSADRLLPHCSCGRNVRFRGGYRTYRSSFYWIQCPDLHPQRKPAIELLFLFQENVMGLGNLYLCPTNVWRRWGTIKDIAFYTLPSPDIFFYVAALAQFFTRRLVSRSLQLHRNSAAIKLSSLFPSNPTTSVSIPVIFSFSFKVTSA